MPFGADSTEQFVKNGCRAESHAAPSAPPSPAREHGAPGHDHVHPHDPDEIFADTGIAGLRWEP